MKYVLINIISLTFSFTTALGVSVQVQPSMITVLDVPPYNTFAIACTATFPASINTNKQFTWRQGSSGSSSVVMTDSGYNITSLDLNNQTSTSILMVDAMQSGSFYYTCEVTVQSTQTSATSFVTVNGNHEVAW